jgi:acyl-CoA synthetase (AMP-forming)/AMP-acid ligase II
MDGDVGEVCLRSPAVMSGYWRAPELTAATITPDGFVRTGDLGWIDDAGRLRLVGRSKEMYVRGGYNVYPMEVEAVLAAHPGIADVAIAPRADDVMGEVGVAVVVPREGGAAPTVDDLRAYAEDRLARYKLPEDLLVVDALPLTAMEKLDRKALAAMVAR